MCALLAGHGEEAAGRTFLAPTDFGKGKKKAGTLAADCISVDWVMKQLLLADLSLVCVLVLDCCRSNEDDDTFKSGSRRSSALSRAGAVHVDGQSELRKLQLSGSQFFVAYACEPGKESTETAANGYFTACLLEQLRVPGLQIEQLLKRTNKQLRERHAEEQVAWTHSSLHEDVILHPLVRGACKVELIE